MTPIDYHDPNDMWRQNGYDPYKGMSDEERMKAGCFQLAAFFVMIIVGLALCALLSGCTTTKYVPVPEYHTDTLIQTKVLKDSVWLHDSVYVHEYQKGDTIFSTTIKWSTKYVEREVHDTTDVSKTDSIPYPVEVIKEVPAKLTWWQQTRLHLANIVLYLLLIVGIIWIGKKHIKRLLGE